MKEQVIAESVAADVAKLYPDKFDVKSVKDAQITIRISSEVRQSGKSTLTELIKKTLIENGYTNIRHMPNGKPADAINIVSQPSGNVLNDILICLVDENG